MTPDFFVTQFPWIAINMAVGSTTTIEWDGRAYSFKKLAPGQFINVTDRRSQ